MLLEQKEALLIEASQEAEKAGLFKDVPVEDVMGNLTLSYHCKGFIEGFMRAKELALEARHD